MIGAVAKIYINAQNAMLVWDGGQDVGKSHLARWLCPVPDYYIEAQLNPDDKDSLVRLATRFIWEVPEVDATTRRAEVAALKDFITREVITVRRAYAKYDMVKPACASLIGTINSDGSGFLRDTTGNRRFLTIRLARIDWGYTQLDVNQLWAQAVALFRAGEPWRLTASEREMRDAINREYQTQNYLEVLFDKYFIVRPERVDEWLTAEQVMKELEEAGLKGSQNQNLKDLKVYLNKLGAKTIRPRLANGSRPTAYAGVSHAPDAPFL
jgi:predicted P-loop ATPase